MKIKYQWMHITQTLRVWVNGVVYINFDAKSDFDVPLKAYVASYGQYSDNTILAVCSTAEAAKAACQKKYALDVAEAQEYTARELPKELTWFNWNDEPTPPYEKGSEWDRNVTLNTAVEGDFYVEVFHYE